MYMYIFINVYTYIYIYIYIHMYIYMYIYTYTYLYSYLYIHLSISIWLNSLHVHAHVHIRTYIHAHVFMHINTHVYIYMYAHVRMYIFHTFVYTRKMTWFYEKYLNITMLGCVSIHRSLISCVLNMHITRDEYLCFKCQSRLHQPWVYIQKDTYVRVHAHSRALPATSYTPFSSLHTHTRSTIIEMHL